ncbi:MAG TPA: tetratricopeptide repeat-containing diguanylate cyclase [Thermoanaerobaculia bacterium]|jgi:diguanylate cyclase (GGDEF)-like protein
MKIRWLLVALLCIASPLLAQEAKVKALLKSGAKQETAGRQEEAVRVYIAARAEAERIGSQELVAESLLALGYVRYYRGETNAALVDLQRAYDIYTALGNDSGRRSALDNIAHVYAEPSIGQYDRAIEYYRQLLPEYQAAGAADMVADTTFNIASTYERKNDLAAALEWYRRALAAEEKMARPGEAAYVKRSIAITLGKLNRPAEALPLLDEAFRTFTRRGDLERANHVLQSRGITYRRMGRLDEAIADLEASRRQFAREKNTRFLEKTEDELALAYAAKGRWQDAYRARTTHTALQRELAEKLREEHTSRLRVQFDSEKKEQENRALTRQNAAAARIRRLQTIILVLGAASLVVVGWVAMRMRRMAMTDELTRLPNRRRLLTVADEQLQRTLGGGQPFSLIAFDIDHFKRINDTWGHAAGDVVLRRVAHACSAALRRQDHLGRTGGEEFTVVLPSTRVEQALTIAERLRSAVENIDCSEIDPALTVTISLGVAEWVQADSTLARIASRADEVLYRAKATGRNRVEVAA